MSSQSLRDAVTDSRHASPTPHDSEQEQDEENHERSPLLEQPPEMVEQSAAEDPASQMIVIEALADDSPTTNASLRQRDPPQSSRDPQEDGYVHVQANDVDEVVDGDDDDGDQMFVVTLASDDPIPISQPFAPSNVARPDLSPNIGLPVNRDKTSTVADQIQLDSHENPFASAENTVNRFSYSDDDQPDENPPEFITPPIHPISSLQDAFNESIMDAHDDPDREVRVTIDAAARHMQLLELEEFPEDGTSRLRQKPGSRFHPLHKLIAQVAFGVHLMHQRLAKSDEEVIKILQGHIDDLDGFIEDSEADFDLQIKDIGDRLKYLRMPLEHGDEFDRMLDNRSFRRDIVSGNDVIERIIYRTAKAMRHAMRDVKKGMESTAEFASYLERIGSDWTDGNEELSAIYNVMRYNAQGWYSCFSKVKHKGYKLNRLLEKLDTTVSEVARRAGIASRKNAAQVVHSRNDSAARSMRLRDYPHSKQSSISYLHNNSQANSISTIPSSSTHKIADKPLPPDPLKQSQTLKNVQRGASVSEPRRYRPKTAATAAEAMRSMPPAKEVIVTRHTSVSGGATLISYNPSVRQKRTESWIQPAPATVVRPMINPPLGPYDSASMLDNYTPRSATTPVKEVREPIEEVEKTSAKSLTLPATSQVRERRSILAPHAPEVVSSDPAPALPTIPSSTSQPTSERPSSQGHRRQHSQQSASGSVVAAEELHLHSAATPTAQFQILAADPIELEASPVEPSQFRHEPPRPARSPRTHSKPPEYSILPPSLKIERAVRKYEALTTPKIAIDPPKISLEPPTVSVTVPQDSVELPSFEDMAKLEEKSRVVPSTQPHPIELPTSDDPLKSQRSGSDSTQETQAEVSESPDAATSDSTPATSPPEDESPYKNLITAALEGPMPAAGRHLPLRSSSSPAATSADLPRAELAGDHLDASTLLRKELVRAQTIAASSPRLEAPGKPQRPHASPIIGDLKPSTSLSSHPPDLDLIRLHERLHAHRTVEPSERNPSTGANSICPTPRPTTSQSASPVDGAKQFSVATPSSLVEEIFIVKASTPLETPVEEKALEDLDATLQTVHDSPASNSGPLMTRFEGPSEPSTPFLVPPTPEIEHPEPVPQLQLIQDVEEPIPVARTVTADSTFTSNYPAMPNLVLTETSPYRTADINNRILFPGKGPLDHLDDDGEEDDVETALPIMPTRNNVTSHTPRFKKRSFASLRDMFNNKRSNTPRYMAGGGLGGFHVPS